MTDRQKKSLARRVTVGIFILIVVAGVFTVVMSYVLGQKDLELQVNNKLESLGGFLSSSLSRPVWNFNTRSVHAISNAVLQDEVVAELKVISDDGSVLYEKDSTTPAGGNRYIKRDIVHDGETIGSIELGIYLEYFEQPLKSRNNWIVIAFLLEVLTLLIITRILLNKMVQEPIKEVEALTNQFASGEYQPKEAAITFTEFMPVETTLRNMGEKIVKQITELEVYQGDLENLVKERTGELFDANESLQQRLNELDETRLAMLSMMEDLDLAKEEAEEATESKSLFLANMSHEIRTPMNAILGMLYLAQKTELTEIQQNYLKKSENSAQLLLGIINDILDFSKIEAGKLEIEQAEFTIDKVLEQLVDVIGYRAEERGLEFLIRRGADVPYSLIGDSLRVGQILSNLCTNAVKFTDSGEVEVSVQSLEKDAQHVHMMFCVRDTGIGLSPKQQEALFQKFSQVDQTITRKYGGTGLGLSISMKLAELMGGRCWIEQSEPGKGTTFCFTANFSYARETEEYRQQLIEKVIPVVSGLRVLIVDDSEASCEILAEMLKSFNFYIETVNSGEEALIHLQEVEKPFDIVLMDWKMPGMMGDQAIGAIHQSKGITPKPKVIMVTSYGREEVMQAAEQVGVDGFLLKPVSPSMLLDAIMSAMGREMLFHEETVVKADLPAINGARLLLVEDNEINREFAMELLHSMGIEVTEAVDGEEGLEKVKAAAYDAILMDIQMPNMDGLEATRQIRNLSTAENDRFANVPIIAMTAQAMAGDREKSLEAGMSDYVTKPIDPKLLANALTKWIVIPQGREVSTPAVEPPVGLKEVENLAALTTINSAAGVRRIGGNESAYLKLLFRFADHYSDTADVIRSLINQSQLDEAERQCHAFKGVAGNIGAEKLFEYSAAIDNQLKHQQSPSQEQLDIFDSLLLQVISEITSLQGSMEGEVSSELVSVDLSILLKLLAKLSDSVDEDLGMAESTLDELVQLTAASEWAASIKQISNAIDEFNIEGTKELIEALKAKLA